MLCSAGAVNFIVPFCNESFSPKGVSSPRALMNPLLRHLVHSFQGKTLDVSVEKYPLKICSLRPKVSLKSKKSVDLNLSVVLLSSNNESK